jgi:transcriptional regulator with XRE-family HTH domain
VYVNTKIDFSDIKVYNKDTQNGGVHLEIGQKIKKARLERGLTQQELGDIVGVQKSAIAKYENGRVVNIKRSTLQKIASALNIRPSELIFTESPRDAADLHARVITDFELMEAIKDYYLLSEENQRMVRDLIRSLKK